MKYYAEHLSNINFVSVYFDTICGDADSMTIETEEGSTSARLAVDGKLYKELKLPTLVPRKRVSLRSGATSFKLPVLKALEVAKPAQRLPPTCICEYPLTGSKVKWKKLPSEHWAELMDLWHCHKPAEPTKNGGSLYDLAMNGFHARPGQAFFSDTYFLVHQKDVAAAPHAEDCSVHDIHNKGESLKLWKWDLDAGPVGRVISEILVELIDAHAVYTYNVNNELLIWVLNPSVTYTNPGNESPVRGCKVFYGPAEELKQQRPDPESVDLPPSIYERLVRELELSNVNLPAAVQSMGKWRLAII